MCVCARVGALLSWYYTGDSSWCRFVKYDRNKFQGYSWLRKPLSRVKARLRRSLISFFVRNETGLNMTAILGLTNCIICLYNFRARLTLYIPSRLFCYMQAPAISKSHVVLQLYFLWIQVHRTLKVDLDVPLAVCMFGELCGGGVLRLVLNVLALDDVKSVQGYGRTGIVSIGLWFQKLFSVNPLLGRLTSRGA